MRDRGAHELGVSFVDLFQRIMDCLTSVRRKTVHVVRDGRQSRSHNLQIFIEHLGREQRLSIHALRDAFILNWFPFFSALKF